MKVRDASAASKTVAFIKVRDASGALKSAAFFKMRDAANALKNALSSLPVTPATSSTSGTSSSSAVVSFTVAFTGTPTSIVWSIEDITADTHVSIFSGQGTTVAGITIVNLGTPPRTVSCTVKCTVVIAGITSQGTATLSYTETS